MGEYEKSLELLKIVLEKDPKLTFAKLYAGYDLLELGRLDESMEMLKAAVKDNPGQLGSVMQQIGLVTLLKKLQDDPSNIGLLNAAAQFYNRRGEYLKSLELSQRVLSQEPLNKQGIQNAVISNRGLGRPQEVIGYGVQYEMVDPDDLQFQYIMAEMYLKTLRCDKATKWLKKILAKDDTYQNAQEWLNQCSKQDTDSKSASPA